MIENKHNQYSKQFMQKILIFIDGILLKSTNTLPEETSKALLNGVLNIRDALFSELVRDNQVTEFNNFIKEQEESKKNQNEAVSSDLSQEKKSANDQPV